ncbi:MAG TPA: DUF4105 domain-containing protein [Puia sp.]|nr:DUF4105 domain-containing protein [Puia sp.]
MKFLRNSFSYLLFAFSYLFSYSQTDSCHLRISLLTCGPGDELYSIWGHTGIRVIDSSTHMDVVFNYGLFDDSDPYFYIKFTRGIMRYAVGAETFDDFMQEYIEEKRSVTEQELFLSCAEKNNLFNALKENITIQKRYYDYHFYKDNCTTRAKEIIKKNIGNTLEFRNIIPIKAPTFRNLIHRYLDSAHHSWDKLGIDLLLGSHLDKQVNNEESMFLPDYLMMGFDSATIHQHKLVGDKKIILTHANKDAGSFLWFTPFALFSLLATIFIVLTFSSSALSLRLLHMLDIIFFLAIGLLGILIAAVWIGRVDTVCRNNINILWAWPTHVVFAFIIKNKNTWIQKYFLITAITSCILLLGWFWWTQELNNAIFPLLIIIIIRSFFISRKK